jgi:hypothetical protein
MNSAHASALRGSIMQSIQDPEQLEALYRRDRSAFKRSFTDLYPEVADQVTAQCWKARLDHAGPGISWGGGAELAFVIIAALIAGTMAKLPQFMPLDEEFFYPRNIGFFVLPLITAYFTWKNTLPIRKVALIALLSLGALVFINALPEDPPLGPDGQTLVLSCIHLPLFLWALLGFAYTGGLRNNRGKRIDYLRFNGELLIITGLLLITGMLLTGLTVALFEVIGVHIGTFYTEYVVVYGLVAAPIVGTYVVQRNPHLVNAVSPLIARIFGPLVLITLAIYLGAMLVAGKDPFSDREFLIIFNALLIGVMAIILFAVAGSARDASRGIGTLVLLLLAVLTLLVDGIALSAIVFRISEWGITPNRLAVLGGNLLIGTNLLWVTQRLVVAVRDRGDLAGVEDSIARFLPIYTVWTAVVVFVFPFLFGFK